MRQSASLIGLSLFTSFLGATAQNVPVVSLGPNGLPCLKVPTVTVQPYYYSSYIAGAATIYNFDGQGNNITINNGPTTFITSGVITVTSTVYVSGNPSGAVAATFTPVPPPTTTPQAQTYTITTTNSAGSTITVTTVQSALRIGEGLSSGTVSNIPSKTAIILGAAYVTASSQKLMAREAPNVIVFEQGEGSAGTSGGSCADATRFSLQNGQLRSLDTDDAIGRNVSDTFAMLSPWPFANDVISNFYLVDGMVHWSTSDRGAATFYICGGGAMYAGFPTPPYSNCSTIILGAIKANRCLADNTDYKGMSTSTQKSQMVTGTSMGTGVATNTGTVVTTSAPLSGSNSNPVSATSTNNQGATTSSSAPTTTTATQYCPQYNLTAIPVGDETYEIYCDEKLVGQDLQPFYPDGYSAQDITDFGSCINICNVWNDQNYQGYCIGVTYVGPMACYPYGSFSNDPPNVYQPGSNAARLIYAGYPDVTDGPGQTDTPPDTATDTSTVTSTGPNATTTSTSMVTSVVTTTTSNVKTASSTTTISSVTTTSSITSTSTTTGSSITIVGSSTSTGPSTTSSSSSQTVLSTSISLSTPTLSSTSTRSSTATGVSTTTGSSTTTASSTTASSTTASSTTASSTTASSTTTGSTSMSSTSTILSTTTSFTSTTITLTTTSSSSSTTCYGTPVTSNVFASTVPMPAASYCPNYDTMIVRNTKYSVTNDYEVYCNSNIGGTDMVEVDPNYKNGFSETISDFNGCLDLCNYINRNGGCVQCEAVVYVNAANACYPKTNIYVHPPTNQYNYNYSGWTAAQIMEAPKYPSPTASSSNNNN